MRKKVVLIRGYADIANRITLAPFERINANSVVLIMALKYPQLLPDHISKFNPDIINIQNYIETGFLLRHWQNEGHDHLLAAEYANIVLDRGIDSVRCVEGAALHTDWFYETVRNIHRNADHTLIEGTVLFGLPLTMIDLGERRMPIHEFIEWTKPHPELG